MQKLLMILIWALASASVIALVTLPISLETQLVAGMFVLVAMMILKLLRPEGIWRLIALAFGTAIVLRYVYWRTTARCLRSISRKTSFPDFCFTWRRCTAC